MKTFEDVVSKCRKLVEYFNSKKYDITFHNYKVINIDLREYCDENFTLYIAIYVFEELVHYPIFNQKKPVNKILIEKHSI